MPRQEDRMVVTDEAILEELRDERADYAALVASRRGLHLEYTRERCAVLARAGLLEAVSDEVVYRITRRGERYLDGHAEMEELERRE